MTVREALVLGTRLLRRHDCTGSDPEREPLDLLAAATGAVRDDLLARPHDALPRAAENAYLRLLERRLAHEPMSHLLGTAWFLGREFAVSPDVLTPRPATEIIVGHAVDAFRSAPTPYAVDVGTGSGCIAISLAGARDDAEVTAIDLSASALRTARRNAEAHALDHRMAFRDDDLMTAAVDGFRDAAHLTVVANLPYLPAADVDRLDPDVRAFEPRLALDGGADGLDLYRRLFDQIAASLPATDVDLFMEILPEQYDALFDEVGARFPGAAVSAVLAGTDGPAIGMRARIRR